MRRSAKPRARHIKAERGTAADAARPKVGRGGIREIEFFVQTQQLIPRASLRAPDLRGGARPWSKRLFAGRLASAAPSTCVRSYAVEHLLQMAAEKQTRLPTGFRALSSSPIMA